MLSCHHLGMARKNAAGSAPATGNRAVAYARVSTEQQAVSGISLDVQESQLRAAAIVKKLELIDVIVDGGESGKNLLRPGMERVLAMVRAHEVDYVIVPKLDRLSRRLRDVLDIVDLFEQNGVELMSLHETLDTNTPFGRFALKLFASLAEMEREVTVERIREVIAHKKRTGQRAGNLPYGFADPGDGYLVPNGQERDVIELIRTWRKEGLSLQAIADSLN